MFSTPRCWVCIRSSALGVFDGRLQVYHLYCGSKLGDASTITTTFPFKKPGIFGRRGTNQTRTVLQAIPAGAAGYWVDRRNGLGVVATDCSRFGLTRVMIAHPCGIPHELVENAGDTRAAIKYAAAGVTAAHAIHGIFGARVAVMDAAAMEEFMGGALDFACATNSVEGRMRMVPQTDDLRSVIEVVTNRDSPRGIWTLAGGTVHHRAFNTVDEDNQIALKARLEGMGYTVVNEQNDRLCFKSMSMRSPGGAMSELAWTVSEGWAKDEPADAIGKSPVFPPWFKDRRAE